MSHDVASPYCCEKPKLRLGSVFSHILYSSSSRVSAGRSLPASEHLFCSSKRLFIRLWLGKGYFFLSLLFGIYRCSLYSSSHCTIIQASNVMTAHSTLFTGSDSHWCHGKRFSLMLLGCQGTVFAQAHTTPLHHNSSK